MLGRQLGDEVGRQRGRVRERLVERLRERREQQLRIGLHEQLVVIRAVALGDEPSVAALVEAALRESDRERVDGIAALLCGKSRERRRVDAAREQHADRNVGEQVRAHGVAQACAQLLQQLGLVVVAQLLDRAPAQDARSGR